MTLKWLFAINLSSWISSLFVMKQGSRGNNLPLNLFLSSWRMGWCKFQVGAAISLVTAIFVSAAVYFSFFPVDLLAAATCWNCNSSFNLWSWNLPEHSFGYEDYEYVIIWNLKNAIVSGFEIWSKLIKLHDNNIIICMNADTYISRSLKKI